MTETPTIRQDISEIEVPVEENEEKVSWKEAFSSYSLVGMLRGEKVSRLFLLLQMHAQLFALLALNALLVGAYRLHIGISVCITFLALKLLLFGRKPGTTRTFLALSSMLFVSISAISHLILIAYLMHTPRFVAWLVSVVLVLVLEGAWDSLVMP